MICLLVVFFGMLWVATVLGAYTFGWWWRGKYESGKSA